MKGTKCNHENYFKVGFMRWWCSDCGALGEMKFSELRKSKTSAPTRWLLPTMSRSESPAQSTRKAKVKALMEKGLSPLSSTQGREMLTREAEKLLGMDRSKACVMLALSRAGMMDGPKPRTCVVLQKPKHGWSPTGSQETLSVRHSRPTSKVTSTTKRQSARTGQKA